MDDMLPMDNTLKNFKEEDDEVLSRKLAMTLADHKGKDVVVIDLRGFNAWTDFFVITGVTSAAHMQGLERRVKEFCLEKGAEILRKSSGKAAIDEDWKLIDLGSVVVHLMTDKARSFYELERLWSQAPLWRAEAEGATPPLASQ